MGIPIPKTLWRPLLIWVGVRVGLQGMPILLGFLEWGEVRDAHIAVTPDSTSSVYLNLRTLNPDSKSVRMSFKKLTVLVSI